MATLKILVVCAALLICAGALTPVPAPSATTVQSSATHSPAVSPTPTPKPPTLYKFINESSNCKIKLDASMNVSFTNSTTNGENNTVTEKLDGKAYVDTSNSHCITKQSAILALVWNEKNGRRLLTFNFTGESRKGSQKWKFANLTLNFTFNDEDFPNYYPVKTSDESQRYWTPGFFGTTVEYERSFRCNALQQFNFYTNMTYTVSLHPSLIVSNFQVQAFEFKSPKEDFGNPRTCTADGKNTGSVIVPIAVGAALGVLVIVVIIAFIISKLVNRKKSSYEAL